MLLKELEHNIEIGVRDRIMAMTAIARIQTAFMGLRKEGDNEPTGAAVRKYATAFKASNAARSRKKVSGTTTSSDYDPPWDDDDDDPAA
jgi:hypothetical protein